MAQDPGTPPGQTSRKTLDDIRREINAEFAVSVDDVPSRAPERDDDEVDDFEAAEAEPKRRGYLKVAGISTLIVTVFLGGYVVGRRQVDERVASAPSAATADGSATPHSSEAVKVAAPEAVEPEPPRSGIASEPASLIRDVTERRVVAEDAGRDAMKQEVTPPAPVPAPKSNAQRREPPAVVPETPTSVKKAPAPVAMIVRDPGDWVESQRQLRTALREWLVRSDSGSASVNPDDAEVMLGADGYTAKTRVRVRVGAHVIMREQQWRRMPGGWMIVEERQADVPRP